MLSSTKTIKPKIKELFPSVIELLNEQEEKKEEKSIIPYVIAFEEKCARTTLYELLCKKISEQGELEANSHHLADLRAFLANRWQAICDTNLCYSIQPHYAINRICIFLAQTIAPFFEISYLQLLMPTVDYDALDLSSAEPIGEQLKKNPDLQLHHYVLSDDARDKKENKQYLISVKACLDSAIDDGILKQTSLFERKTLNEQEAKRVITHSAETKQYYDLLTKYVDLKTKGSSFGAALRRLIDFLQKGSVLGTGTEYKAGLEAIQGIKDFYDFLNLLTPKEREFLYQLTTPALTIAPNFKIIWFRLISRAELEIRMHGQSILSDTELNDMLKELALPANITTQVPCALLISADISHILTRYHISLYSTYPESKKASDSVYKELQNEIKKIDFLLEKKLNRIDYQVNASYENSDDRLFKQVAKTCALPNTGNTLLHEAIDINDEAMIYKIANCCPESIKRVNQLGKTPLYQVVEKIYATSFTWDTRIIKYLLSRDPSPFDTFKYAIQFNNDKIMLFLSGIYRDFSIKDYFVFVEKCLLDAVHHANIQAVTMIVKLVEGRPASDKLFPYFAAKRKHIDIFKILISVTNKKDELSDEDDNIQPSLIAAIRQQEHDTLKFMLDHGANPRKLLIKSIKRTDLVTVEALLMAGANPNGGQEPPLRVACRYNNKDMVELLLRYHADPEISYVFDVTDPLILTLLNKKGLRFETALLEGLLKDRDIINAKEGEDLAFALMTGLDSYSLTSSKSSLFGKINLPFPWKYVSVVNQLREWLARDEVALEGLKTVYPRIKRNDLIREIKRIITLLMNPITQNEFIVKRMHSLKKLKLFAEYPNNESKEIKRVPLDWIHIKPAALLSDNMVVCAIDKEIIIIDPFKGKVIHEFKVDTKPEKILALPNNKIVIISESDDISSYVRIFDLKTGKKERAFCPRYIYEAQCLPNGDMVFLQAYKTLIMNESTSYTYFFSGDVEKLFLLDNNNFGLIEKCHVWNGYLDRLKIYQSNTQSFVPSLHFEKDSVKAICGLRNGRIIKIDKNGEMDVYSAELKLINPKSIKINKKDFYALLPLEDSYFAISYVNKKGTGCLVNIHDSNGSLVCEFNLHDPKPLSDVALKLMCETHLASQKRYRNDVSLAYDSSSASISSCSLKA